MRAGNGLYKSNDSYPYGIRVYETPFSHKVEQKGCDVITHESHISPMLGRW